jgi:PAS domain S-box-containing protein
MTASASATVSAVLPPEPASARRARRLVEQALTDAGLGDFVDVAVLLVSELVTNAVLHAGTEMTLRCRIGPGRARVEIHDGSQLAPAIRHYDDEATTGRGLELVAALAAAWGVEAEADGKTLWFELGEHAPHIEGPHDEPASGAGRGFTVELLNAPVALVAASIEYGDTVLRELALLAIGGEVAAALPDGWHLPQFDVTPILAAVERALATGAAHEDLQLTFPAGAGQAARDRMALVDVADGLARAGELLSAAALPEVGVCRHWLHSQIAEQELGVAPGPWTLPEPLEPSRSAAQLAPEVIAAVLAATDATVVADDANRIILVNPAAAELLGWEAGSLEGQRLTLIIPPELREAHLAGFSRLQLTGEPRLLDRSVEVPALRRDGTRVPVQLTISRLRGLHDRGAFRAVLRPGQDT